MLNQQTHPAPAGANSQQLLTPRLDENQAAAELNISKRTLQCWRVQGKGPAYLKLGRAVRYDRATLQNWLAAQERKHTSQ
jgi:hypothetical protein